MSTAKIPSRAQSTVLQELARSAVGPHLFVQVASDDSNSLWLSIYHAIGSDNSVTLIGRSGPYKSIADVAGVLQRHATSLDPRARLPASLSSATVH